MLGDLLALVYETRVKREEIFQPLHPVKAIRADNAIIVSFQRPANSLPLQWDRSWMPPVPNYGFEVEGAEGAGAATIAEVKITGPSEVTLHINCQASSKILKVRYAMNQPKAQGWAPGRGQLIAPTPSRSAFAALGMQVPETINHYAIRFEIAV
jgi:hypothetical protein